MTKRLSSNMLGVPIAEVDADAMKLQQKGLIDYAGGHIMVLDRPGLEKSSCECYAEVKNGIRPVALGVVVVARARGDFVKAQPMAFRWPLGVFFGTISPRAASRSVSTRRVHGRQALSVFSSAPGAE